MVVRKRIRSTFAQAGGGGGAPPTTANLAWGPDFGEGSSGSDGVSMSSGVHLGMSNVLVANINNPRVNLKNAANAIVYNDKSVGVSQTMGFGVLYPDKSVGCQHSNPSNAIVFTDKQVGCNHTNPSNAVNYISQFTPSTQTDDSSGSARNFTINGSLTPRRSTQNKYRLGLNFPGAVSAYLSQTDAAFRITGDLSVFMAVELDSPLPAAQRLMAQGATGETEAANYLYHLSVGADGTIAYFHEYGAGTNYAAAVSSPGAITSGFHTITLRRDATARSIVVKVDGTTVINTTYAAGEVPTGGTTSSLRVGLNHEGADAIDGGVFEVRIWNSLVSQTELDKLADPNDSTYTGTAIGSETGMWLFEGDVKGILPGVHLSATSTGAPIWMAVEVATSTSATSLPVNIPAGAQIGDLLLLMVAVSVSGAVITTPTGWSAGAAQGVQGNAKARVVYRVVDGTEGSTVTAVWGGGTTQAVVECHLIRGVDTTTPVAATAGGGASVADPVITAVTPGVANCMVFYWLNHIHALTQTHTPPASNTETSEEEATTLNTVSGNSGYRIFNGTGSTGTATVNCNEIVASEAAYYRIAVAPGPVVLAQ